MIPAEIKGKIPEIQNMEDVLTSNVFGSLKYISQTEVLVRILTQAKTLDGIRLSKSILDDLATYTAEIIFWPYDKDYGEPDLIIKFSKGDIRKYLCIEVKFYSSKHGEGKDDQLKRYFDGVNQLSISKGSTFLGLIYLTKYPSREEVKTSVDLLVKSGFSNAKDKLYQLKWTEVSSKLLEIINAKRSSSLTDADIFILKDLYEYFEFKNLTIFTKFSFLSKSFNISPDHFYDISKFNGFSFVHSCLNTHKDMTIFYGG